MLIVGGVLLAVLLAAGAWLYQPDLPRAALEAKYGAGPAEFRQVLGLRMHVRDSGPPEAPAIVLLHGFGSSLQAWDQWAALLQGQYRVLRLDLPGFGLTGPDLPSPDRTGPNLTGPNLTGSNPGGDYSDSRAAALLAALLDQLGIARAHVIGSSMGGRIAWGFAASHPQRVAKLVLMAPDGFASDLARYDTPQRIPPLMRLLPYVLPMPLLRGGIAPAYADPAALTEPVVQRYRDMMLAPGVRQAILDRMRGAILPRPEPLLARITAPTLLLWGEQDRMIPPANAQDYLRAIPGSRLVLLPALGHVPMEEAPAAALAPVLAFLAEP